MMLLASILCLIGAIGSAAAANWFYDDSRPLCMLFATEAGVALCIGTIDLFMWYFGLSVVNVDRLLASLTG